MARFCARGPLAVVLLLLGAQTIALTQQPQKTTAPPQKSAAQPGVSTDEQQIRQGVVAFVEQYNGHKADALTALFAPDARMVFADGTEVNGRDEIKESFEEAFKENPKCAVSVVVDSIRFLTPDVAVEEGSTTMFPDGETLTSRDRYTVL